MNVQPAVDGAQQQQQLSRPITEADINHLNVKDLHKLATEQKHLWPKTLPSLTQKTLKNVIRGALLDPRNGFTTTNPIGAANLSKRPRGRPKLTAPVNLPPKSQSKDATAVELHVHKEDSKTESEVVSPEMNLNSILRTAGTEGMQTRVLHVMLEDHRVTGPDRCLAQELIMTRTDDGTSDRYWSFDAKELVEKLICSCAVMDSLGPMKISYPHHLDKRFNVPLLTSDGALSSASLCKPSLTVGSDGILYLTIESFGKVSQALEQPSVCSETLISDKSDSKTSPSVTKSCKPSKHLDSAISPIITKLQDLLANRTGHTVFEMRRGKTLQNAEVVEQWKFIGSFVRDTRGTLIGDTIVLKEHIYRALKMSETTVHQAETALDWIKMYGERDNKFGRYCEEVALHLQLELSRPQGSTALFKYLKEWDEVYSV